MRLAFLVLLLALGLTAVPAAPAGAAVVWAVGDGGVSGPEDDAVAARIEREGVERLLYLGDVYETGTAQEYSDHYAPSFGRFRSLTSPTPGNHEWANRAQGYDPYWGSRAPQTDGGHYYSFDFAGWHFVSLNSEENTAEGSPQVEWLKRDLARNPGTCTLAFFHKPRYTAGPHTSSDTRFEPFWAALEGRAVGVLSGHDHNYQRLRPERGLTQWVVGSGGRKLQATNESDPRLAAVSDTAHGALRLQLEPGRANFTFIATDGARLDRSSLGCRPHTSSEPSPGSAPASPQPAPSSPSAAEEPSPTAGESSPEAGSSPAAVRPAVRVLRPRQNARYSRRLKTFSGTARLPRGTQVRVTLARRAGRACVAFDGRRFRRSTCARLPTFVPPGGSAWRFVLPSAPATGRYRLVARVMGSSGVLVRDGASFRIGRAR